VSTKDLILIGAGGHARACIEVIEQSGEFQIKGLVGLSHEVGAERLGYKVLATDSELTQLAHEFTYAIISIGQIISSAHRVRLYNLALNAGFTLPTIISPLAKVSRHASVGMGTIIMHGAIIGPGVTIGDNCIINSGVILEHDTIVEDNCHLSTRSTINGNVSVGEGTFVGSASVIKAGITIGANSLVGMGQIVRKSLPTDSKFLGEFTK
jgi:sugar O-acyltransferase (sialic acid O-acetyltransferase NeuD family)